MVPNGILKAKPPANGAPPGVVWQAWQSAAWVRYSPRFTRSALASWAGTPVTVSGFSLASAVVEPPAKDIGSRPSISQPAKPSGMTMMAAMTIAMMRFTVRLTAQPRS